MLSGAASSSSAPLPFSFGFDAAAAASASSGVGVEAPSNAPVISRAAKQHPAADDAAQTALHETAWITEKLEVGQPAIVLHKCIPPEESVPELLQGETDSADALSSTAACSMGDVSSPAGRPSRRARRAAPSSARLMDSVPLAVKVTPRGSAPSEVAS